MLELIPPAVYVPLDRPVYEVAPGLKPLGFSFVNGAADGQILQIDREFLRYHE